MFDRNCRILLTKDGKPKAAAVGLADAEHQSAAVAADELAELPDYEINPAATERAAFEIVRRHLPRLSQLTAVLRQQGFPLITIEGLPAPSAVITTPVDGLVAQPEIKPHVGFLVALLATSGGWGGFAFRSENGGRLQRGVVPVKEHALEASSQGFGNDLGWHQDNCNQPMVHEAGFEPGKPFMNPEQGFAAIRTRSDVPMEVVSCDEILFELEQNHGAHLVGHLFEPDYAVRWPDSHMRGGELAVENVPVLVRDGAGHIHSRYHAANVVGLNDNARHALNKLHEVAASTQSIIEISSRPGDLIVYSNTRMLHRRRAFLPSFDGADRFYVRVYFAPVDALPIDRVID